MANDPSVVFLLGVPRSGTTLLSCLLNQHHRLYCPPEPWLLLGLDALGRVPTEHMADPPLLAAAITEFLENKRLLTLKQAALAIYQQALKKSGKTIFVDKTPRYYQVLSLIQSFLPENKAILLVRNPLDVAASFKTAWSVNLPEIIASRGNTPFLFDYVLGFRYLLAFAADHQVVKVHYENLVANPAIEMNRIFNYLTLSPLILDKQLDIQKSYTKSSFGDKKIMATPYVHTNAIDTYKNVFSRNEIAILINALGKEVFFRLGYEDQCTEICEKLNITPSNKASLQLFKIAERYAKRRRQRCAMPKSKGVLEQKIKYLKQHTEYLKQQFESIQIQNEGLNKENMALSEQLQQQLEATQAQNDSLSKENIVLSEQLQSVQRENETLQQQLYLHRNMRLKARLQENLEYIDKRLRHVIQKGLWRIAQGPPLPPLPKITIVTPVLNSAQFIESTLGSVLTQQYSALEFIIVDGGSTDDTLAIIERLQKESTFSHRINQVISEPDQGMYDAIAKGFSRATGEILAYLNADDLLEGGALMAVGSYFARHPKVSVIYHEDTVLVNGWKYPNIRQPKHIGTGDLLNKHILFQDGVFFRRNAYQAIGGLRRELKLAGDYALWLRLSARFKFTRRLHHVSCFRIRSGQLSENTPGYYQEVDQVRSDFLMKASGWQKLSWQLWIKYRFLSRKLAVFFTQDRLFFPIDFGNMPPPSVVCTGTEYGQAVSPIDDKPAGRFLFSTPDTRFGDQTINYIYLDTQHKIAIAYPPVPRFKLDELYQQYYSAPPLVVKNPEGTSPYRYFNGKRWWEKALLRLPVEKLARFLPNGWLNNTLTELTFILQAASIDTHAALKLLDIGCFEGHLLDEIAIQKPWRAYGLEPNTQAVAVAQGKGHCVWQGAAEDAVKIVPHALQFNVIFMGQSIEHVDNPVQVLRKLRLLLAPGGVLVLSTPNLDSRQIDWFGPTWAHWHTPYHRYIFSRKGLFALAKQAGLQLLYFKTFSHCYWTAMSIVQNALGLGGSVSHAVNFDPIVCKQAQRIHVWCQLFWNHFDKGDYSFLVMGEGTGE
ncbi:family 2 glycosyl transferase [Candidatus Nitrosoglobus terrae]|uniref:Family 2 glycosyl transferase n=1 Tax=Candidatus Nitrosoglobus terrae TaxID=1630141 RepID=A0A1Q2SM28_9GAMM|nr:sulfotransferase [Candidatus Nitrosoglobus terrae]BAW80181.1 family 2 glycosyl transferase [Candidatus Nitrosoglobus terrae]